MKLILSRMLGLVPPDVKTTEDLRGSMPETKAVDPPNHVRQIEAHESLGQKAVSLGAAALGLVVKFTE